jgi:RNA polymerase sigma-70 factor (ECF subfamily)
LSFAISLHASDAELMLAVRAGDDVSFDVLLARHRGPIVHFLFRMVQNSSIAEELAQEVFLRIYQSRERYTADAKFTTWLYRIATNRALNWLRDNRRYNDSARLDAVGPEGIRRQIPDPHVSAEERALRQEILDGIKACVMNLPDRQRAAVLMHKYEEMDYHQIAEALDSSPQAVKSLLFRAYTALRQSLEGVTVY